jgi:hypothetical protein
MGLEVIINTVKEENNNLKRDKLVVVCGGATDTGKNQITKGLKYMTNFVKKRKNTNVIMRMSHRFDLEVSCCSDNEVMVFNRKISKEMKTCNHTEIINISSNRKCYTKHRLHMNVMGEEWITHTKQQMLSENLSQVKR